MSFRDAMGNQVDWIRTELPFSNFLHVDRNYFSDSVLRRIFSLARKQGFRSLLVEEIAEANCALLADENQALSIRDPSFAGSKVHRICFFATPPKQKPGPDDFIGYVVFKMDSAKGVAIPRCHTYECVIRPPRCRTENSFLAATRSYNVGTSVGEFTVQGVLYAQQNDRTCVCAHVALRSVLACALPEADISYSQINAIAGIDHKTRTVGQGPKAGGLDEADLEKVLNTFAIPFGKLVNEPASAAPLPPGTEYQRDLYTYLESGCPALLGFQLLDPKAPPDHVPRHMIPVIGHTFNDDAWVPNAQRIYFNNDTGYFPSENWLSSYVIHDDNVGPYFCLPRHYLKADQFRLILGLKPVVTALSAVDVEALAFNIVRAVHTAIPRIDSEWYDRFAAFARCDLLILRTQLIRRNAYVEHLNAASDRNGTKVSSAHAKLIQDALSDWVWMTEVSAQELFSTSRRKFGEIILPSTVTAAGKAPFFLARLPALTVLSQNKAAQILSTLPSGHTPLYEAGT